MSDNLKPCPCGKGRVYILDAGGGDWWVECSGCGDRTGDVNSYYYPSKDEAIQAWNRRSETAPYPALISAIAVSSSAESNASGFSPRALSESTS
ncbi:MAG: Lar family restriction alleviation protein [Patescibacteria group bacterium]|nr:Lar family restriction alleviation protein [Patescibacteria group bacterium]